MEMSVVGLITARGGSKGIPGKNLADLCGKPLIAWTIEAALAAGSLDRVIVSTDDGKIAEVSAGYGAEVPFMRPAELAGDESPHIDVLIHAIKWLVEDRGREPEYVVLLQPTSPLRVASDIDSAVSLALEKDADSVVSVCEAQSHPYTLRRITDDGTLADLADRPDGYLPRQKMPRVYAVNGAVYAIKSTVLLKEKTLFPIRTIPYIMDIDRSIDIDTPWDLKLAEMILTCKMESGE